MCLSLSVCVCISLSLALSGSLWLSLALSLWLSLWLSLSLCLLCTNIAWSRYYTFCYGALSSSAQAGEAFVDALASRDMAYDLSPLNAGCTDFPVRELQYQLSLVQ